MRNFNTDHRFVVTRLLQWMQKCCLISYLHVNVATREPRKLQQTFWDQLARRVDHMLRIIRFIIDAPFPSEQLWACCDVLRSVCQVCQQLQSKAEVRGEVIIIRFRKWASAIGQQKSTLIRTASFSSVSFEDVINWRLLVQLWVHLCNTQWC